MPRLLQIAQLGAGVLRQPAQPVTDIHAPALQSLIDDMLATVAEANGVGLAAPQVHVSQRVIVVSSRPNARYPQAPLMAPTAMINPEVLSSSSETVTDWEGCLSIPGLRGQVPRARQLQLRYLTREGESVTEKFSDFVARIIQHECDHLDGIAFIERVNDLRTLVTEKEFLKRLAAGGQ